MKTQKLTPDVLLAAPRRSPAKPNRDGTLAMYTVSRHEWDGETTNSVRIMDLATTLSWTVTEDAKVHDVCWMPGTSDEIIYLMAGEQGNTSMYIAKVSAPDGIEHAKLSEFNAPVANLKLRKIGDDRIILVVTGLVGDDGYLHNENTVKKKSSARTFDDVNVRQWEIYYKKQRYSIWCNTLIRHNGEWTAPGALHNLVKPDHLEVPFNIYDKVDASDYFDVCEYGVAFFARDLVEVRDPNKTRVGHLYYVPVASFSDGSIAQPLPISVNTDHTKLHSGFNVRFSPDAKTIAFGFYDVNDSSNQRIYTAEIDTLEAADIADQYSVEYSTPISFEFVANRSDSLLLTTEDCGHTVLSRLDLAAMERPTSIYQGGTLRGFSPLSETDSTHLLISSDSLVDSSLWQVLNIAQAKITRDISSATGHGKRFGLSKSQVQEIWFSGADNLQIHSLIAYPSDFDDKKKWPWVFIPHGGPESAWDDSWTPYMWNLLLWAEQGYVVVAPNISGSTGFGLDFTRRVYREWGGKPFQDCLKLLEHLETYSYLDEKKAVYAGASYAGYLGSWFFCHDVIKKFCGAIWHDGIFSLTLYMLYQDKSVDDNEFGGDPKMWTNYEELQKWDPATPERLRNWKNCPPTLIIHSEKDYRIPITEGLAAFKTLQYHGITSRFLTFEDEGHFVTKPENALVWCEEVFSWVKRCVDGDLKRE